MDMFGHYLHRGLNKSRISCMFYVKKCLEYVCQNNYVIKSITLSLVVVIFKVVLQELVTNNIQINS